MRSESLLQRHISDDEGFYLSHFMIASKVPEGHFVNKRLNCFVSVRYVLSDTDNFAVAKLGRKTEGKVCNQKLQMLQRQWASYALKALDHLCEIGVECH